MVGLNELVSAVRDEDNLLRVALLNDDLFFEIRKDGRRHVAFVMGFVLLHPRSGHDAPRQRLLLLVAGTMSEGADHKRLSRQKLLQAWIEWLCLN